MMTLLAQLADRETPLKIPEAGTMLGLHRVSLYRMVREGRFPVMRIGSAIQIDPGTLVRDIESRSGR